MWDRSRIGAGHFQACSRQREHANGREIVGGGGIAGGFTSGATTVVGEDFADPKFAVAGPFVQQINLEDWLLEQEVR